MCVYMSPHTHMCAHEWFPTYMYTYMHIYVIFLGDARWIGGLTKVRIYPMCANLLQNIVVLATPIQGLRDTGWQVT